ncbi:hypothetical protein Tco_0587738 [Tanacetum coccineum]
MVAFLKKPEGSEGFHQIVDFLNSTHIKYALTENPTIYVSLIYQFWQTTSASTSENGEMEITATIDGRVKTVTKASIRRHLKLEDSDGIITLPNTEASYGGEGSTVPVESHHTPTSAPSTSQPPTSPPSMQTTHFAEEATTMPYDLPLPRVHSLGSDEGSMTLYELTVLCTTLSKKVESLESNLKQTKLTYGGAYTKLIMKVKKLENRIKSSKARRRVGLIVSKDEGDLEDPSKQERKIAQLDEDEGITLFTAPEEVSTASPEVKTTAESLVYIRRSAEKRKDKGKDIMKEAKPAQKKTKLQLEQERLGYEEALRLEEQLDEEERKRIVGVHEKANTFNAEEWDNIQAQIEVDEELAQKLQAKCNTPKIRQETEVPQLSSPPHTNVADEVASTSVDVIHGGAATTRQTKKVYGNAFTRLIKKVKKLEQTVKTSQARRSQEDQPGDQLGVFSAAKVLADAAKNVHTYTKRRKSVSTGSGGVSTASRLFSTTKESVSTVGASMPVSTAEWEDIQPTIEADEELAQRIQAEERGKITLEEKHQDCLQNLSTRERDILPNKELKKGGTSHSHNLNRELICLTISSIWEVTLYSN